MTGSISDPLVLMIRIVAGLALSAPALVLIVVLWRGSENASIGAARFTSFRNGWKLAPWGALLWFVPADLTFGVFARVGVPLSISAPAADVVLTVILLCLAVFFSEAIPEELVSADIS